MPIDRPDHRRAPAVQPSRALLSSAPRRGPVRRGSPRRVVMNMARTYSPATPSCAAGTYNAPPSKSPTQLLCQRPTIARTVSPVRSSGWWQDRAQVVPITLEHHRQHLAVDESRGRQRFLHRAGSRQRSSQIPWSTSKVARGFHRTRTSPSRRQPDRGLEHPPVTHALERHDLGADPGGDVEHHLRGRRRRRRWRGSAAPGGVRRRPAASPRLAHHRLHR